MVAPAGQFQTVVAEFAALAGQFFRGRSAHWPVNIVTGRAMSFSSWIVLSSGKTGRPRPLPTSLPTRNSDKIPARLKRVARCRPPAQRRPAAARRPQRRHSTRPPESSWRGAGRPAHLCPEQHPLLQRLRKQAMAQPAAVGRRSSAASLLWKSPGEIYSDVAQLLAGQTPEDASRPVGRAQSQGAPMAAGAGVRRCAGRARRRRTLPRPAVLSGRRPPAGCRAIPYARRRSS